jgi:protein-S-isoprenylcysteine O-methyltransferase Ste14
MHDPVALPILIGWAAFWLYWLATAIRTKSDRIEWGRSAGIRVLMLLVIVLLLRHRGFNGQAETHNAWRQGLGAALFVLGLALAVWARVHIGRNWGTPMTEKADGELVTTGPYRTIRHPIYSGILLAMAATALAVELYWLVPFVVFSAYFVYSAAMEERYMATRFPDSYPEYKRKTKMLVPFVF